MLPDYTGKWKMLHLLYVNWLDAEKRAKSSAEFAQGLSISPNSAQIFISIQ